ncbi:MULTISPECIES: hypothetical protein [unclassified Rhodococcus (in: high G+C Gram-positive bacteria)]|uniref:hypothetical protein n=1 Tax=unclassified Rhodococcus (in: high G+C Gram-positive bacteria) TaxID=192944 RepID=UPI000B9BCBDD|nr:MULTISPECIES: hypothetical protein [unclassified Rhodococcus (in: high G+C Gram-positive bacteria)]OZE35391.1 hypothetical protein CH259_15055 [Rhodococcus sp. 05-2254-4]OZE47819.1 hypothetical protein CH261_07650 [Rhodococcus sp. 05-2254-3]OZE49030.1 hypothetical protein CH283_15435 [Rhodococcus sp. 05-2254-2]OZF44689.1 hypothetical protein CH291_20325 [Rhodococcus sp. 14-1411-2a]
MTSDHSELGADLLALAETVLTRLEPILRRVAETQQDRDRQGCSWCPVCALAALVRGERHDLVELVASESAVVIALLRQLLADHTTSGATHSAAQATPTSPPPGTAPEPGSGSAGVPSDPAEVADVSIDTKLQGDRPASFVPITVRVKNSRSDEQERP